MELDDFTLPSFFINSLIQEVTLWEKDKANIIFMNQENNEPQAQISDSPLDLINKIIADYGLLNFDLRNISGINDLNTFPSYTAQISIVDKDKNLEIDFDSLSSGEKILMALFLYLYHQTKKDVLPKLLLLDEVEATLHPAMISKFIQIIKDNFVGESKMKVIMATHSPTTVALTPDDAVFSISTKNETTEIKNIDKSDAIEILSDKIMTLKKSLTIFDSIFNKEIAILTEGNNIKYIKKFIDLIFDQPAKDKIHITTDIENITGKDQLKLFFDFFSKIPHEKIIIVIWDCDAKSVYKSLIRKNNTIPFGFKKNENNNLAKSGIENLFEESLFKDNFLTKIIQENKIKETKFSNNKKNEFCEYILERKNKDDFVNFGDLEKLLKTELDAIDK